MDFQHFVFIPGNVQVPKPTKMVMVQFEESHEGEQQFFSIFSMLNPNFIHFIHGEFTQQIHERQVGAFPDVYKNLVESHRGFHADPGPKMPRVFWGGSFGMRPKFHQLPQRAQIWCEIALTLTVGRKNATSMCHFLACSSHTTFNIGTTKQPNSQTEFGNISPAIRRPWKIHHCSLESVFFSDVTLHETSDFNDFPHLFSSNFPMISLGISQFPDQNPWDFGMFEPF